MTGKRTLPYLLPGIVILAVAGYLVSGAFSAGETTVSALARDTHFHGIAVDPRNADRLYLATHHGVFVVGPGGRARQVSESRHDFMGFTSHPADPDLLYASGHPAGGGNLGLIVSKDGGRTWQTVGEGAYGPSDFHQMAISPVDSDTVFGIYGTELQASRDGGRTWRVVSQIPDRIFNLAASARSRDGLFAASAGGLLYSADGGQSWVQLTDSENPVTTVAATAEGQVIIYVVGEGLLQAREPRFDWVLLNNRFGSSVVLHFAVARSDEGRTAYSVTFDPGNRSQALYVSRDGGRRWARLGAEQG